MNSDHFSAAAVIISLISLGVSILPLVRRGSLALSVARRVLVGYSDYDVQEGWYRSNFYIPVSLRNRGPKPIFVDAFEMKLFNRSTRQQYEMSCRAFAEFDPDASINWKHREYPTPIEVPANGAVTKVLWFVWTSTIETLELSGARYDLEITCLDDRSKEVSSTMLIDVNEHAARTLHDLLSRRSNQTVEVTMTGLNFINRLNGQIR